MGGATRYHFYAPFERLHLSFFENIGLWLFCYATEHAVTKPWSPFPMDTTQNASTVTSLLTDTLECSLTYLLTYNRRPHLDTNEYRGILSRYIPWRKIVGTAQH